MKERRYDEESHVPVKRWTHHCLPILAPTTSLSQTWRVRLRAMWVMVRDGVRGEARVGRCWILFGDDVVDNVNVMNRER